MSRAESLRAYYQAHPRPRHALIDRLERHVMPEPNTGCWLWTGALTRGGYSNLDSGYGHRIAYTFYRGPIPAGQHLDHRCRVRSCVNPWHLEIVTPRQNVLRSTNPRAVASLANRCLQGHSVADGRRCRICAAAYARRWRADRRAVAKRVTEAKARGGKP